MSYDIVGGMSEKVLLRAIRGGSGLVAMVIIWRLVETALKAGIDGVLFFIGVAAIAGLGGYELRWAIEAVKSRKQGNSDQGSGK